MRNHEGEAVPELDDLSAADSGTIRPSSREAALVVTDSSRLGPLHHSIRKRVAALEENERAGRASTRHGSVTEADENQIKIEHPVSSLFQGSDSERRQRRWSVGAVGTVTTSGGMSDDAPALPARARSTARLREAAGSPGWWRREGHATGCSCTGHTTVRMQLASSARSRRDTSS